MKWVHFTLCVLADYKFLFYIFQCFNLSYAWCMQGLLSVGFPIENRGSTVGMSALRSHLDRTKHLTFVKRISDFHLLLKVATFLDVKADVPPLAACVKTQSRVPEGYQLLIESLASQG